MPELTPDSPPYMQIADHYRDAIARHEFVPGDRLPTMSDIATTWQVSPGTAHKAVRALQSERLVIITRQGTFVADRRAVPSPVDRIRAEHEEANGHQLYEHVTAAGIVLPRAHETYVAGLLNLDGPEDIARVIRRETITQDGDTPVALTVLWHPPEFAESVPALITTAPLSEPSSTLIERATGRRVTHIRNWVEARQADDREAEALNTTVGATIIAGTYLLRDKRGPIEYGEYVLPSGNVLSFENDL